MAGGQKRDDIIGKHAPETKGGSAEQRDRNRDCESTHEEGVLSRNVGRSTTSVETGMTGILQHRIVGPQGDLTRTPYVVGGVGMA
jgi:hypothetical protein